MVEKDAVSKDFRKQALICVFETPDDIAQQTKIR